MKGRPATMSTPNTVIRIKKIASSRVMTLSLRERGRAGDARRRGDDHHGRRALQGDQRRLPPRRALGARLLAGFVNLP